MIDTNGIYNASPKTNAISFADDTNLTSSICLVSNIGDKRKL